MKDYIKGPAEYDVTHRAASKREQRIEANKRLGLDASAFEAMTDEQFESDLDFLNEKALRHGENATRSRKPK